MEVYSSVGDGDSLHALAEQASSLGMEQVGNGGMMDLSLEPFSPTSASAS